MHPIQIVLPTLCVLHFSSQFKMVPIIIPGRKRYAFSSCLLLRGYSEEWTRSNYTTAHTLTPTPPPKKEKAIGHRNTTSNKDGVRWVACTEL
jgi:hypothetical protein